MTNPNDLYVLKVDVNDHALLSRIKKFVSELSPDYDTLYDVIGYSDPQLTPWEGRNSIYGAFVFLAEGRHKRIFELWCELDDIGVRTAPPSPRMYALHTRQMRLENPFAKRAEDAQSRS